MERYADIDRQIRQNTFLQSTLLDQCDQTVTFLECLSNQFSHKNSPNFGLQFGHI